MHAPHYFKLKRTDIMKNAFALFAIALSIAAAVPARADNPSDAPLVAESRGPEAVYSQATQRPERRVNKKERKQAQQAARQQPASQSTTQQSGGSSY